MRTLAPRLPRLPGALIGGLAILPVAFPLFLIAKYSVDVPFWDQWWTAELFVRQAQGVLSIVDLFELHNEYRQFFPHLLFLGLGMATRWKVRYEMLVSVLLACLVSLNIYRISRVAIGPGTTKLWLLAAANLFIFSPVQYGNWLFGIQVVYFVPIACLTTCLSVAYSRASRATKLVIGVVLSGIATFSAANGVLCWVLVLPVLLVVGGWRRSVRPVLAAGWAMLGLLSLGLYLYGYEQPRYSPSLTEALRHPGRAILYLAAFLGASSAPGSDAERLMVAIVLGALLTILFGGACLYLWTFRGDRSLCVRAIAFVMIGAYSLGTALMAMTARLGFGIAQAADDRYTTFSLYLTVSLIYLLMIVIGHARENGHLPSWVKTAKLAPGVLAACILLHGLAAAQGVIQADVWRSRLGYGKACLLFINVTANPAQCFTMSPLYNSLSWMAHYANALNDLGYLRPRLIASEALEPLLANMPFKPEPGAFENLVRTADGRFTASGWAVLPERGEPAHAVLLTYQNGLGRHTIFAIVPPDDLSWGWPHTFRQREQARTRWRHTFAPDELAVPAGHLEAWAFDAESGRAFKLAGIHDVLRPP